MSEKKMVRRSVAIALGIGCIVVVACLVGAFSYFIIDKNNTISSLNSQVTNLRNQIDSLNLNITNLQNQMNNLSDILNLRKSNIWYNGTLVIVPLLELTVLDENAPYAGYVSVQVSWSQSNETVVIVIYYSIALQYRQEESRTLSSNGTAIFPVLPSGMSIYFEDPSLSNSSETATVTITYYY
jgi:predicted PurR-regulated permease PerM